jgi:hypothetical protein
MNSQLPPGFRKLRLLEFIALAAAALCGSPSAKAQAFNGSFTFASSDSNVTSFSYNGPAIGGLTVSPLVKAGVTTSSSSGNFRASAWPAGATSGNDTFTGTVDAARYFEFTLTAAAGKLMDLPTLNFGIGRSATGPRQWQWRSSVDGYTSAIPVTTVNAGLTHDAGVLTNPDSNSSWGENIIATSGAAYENLSTITFRLYGYNAESTSGTGGLQGALTFGGTLKNDDSVGNLITVTIEPDSIAEGGAANGTITLSQAAPAGGLAVSLASSDTGEATVPASVVVAQGETTQNFTVQGVADSLFDGDHTLTISATADGYVGGSAPLTVTNIDAEPVFAMSLTAKNTPATQNFDGLGNSTIGNVFSGSLGAQTNFGIIPALSSVAGWYGTQAAGTTASSSPLTANDGSSISSGMFSYGGNGTVDRAYGSLGSGGRVMAFGALIKNDGSETLQTILLSFNAEIWREGAAENTVTFGYGKLGGTVNTTNFLTEASAQNSPPLNIVSPPAEAAAPRDGNLAANRITFTDVPLTGVNLAPGETLFIRWTDDNAAGDDSGIGIDDFSVKGIDAPLVDQPVFSLTAGTYIGNQSVGISNYADYADDFGGDGFSIHYTTDGSTPTAASQLYNNATGIALTDGNGPVILKAIAISNAPVSESFVTSATYVLPKNVADLTALRSSPLHQLYRVTGPVTFTAGTGFRNTKFFQDNGAGIQIDDFSAIVTTSYSAGDNVRNIIGRLASYNGQLQLTPQQDFGAPVSTGNPVTPVARALATLTDADQARLVTIPGVEFESAGSAFGAGGAITNIRDSSLAGFTGIFRNIFGDSDITGALIPGGPNTLTGIVQRSSATVLAIGARNMGDIVYTGAAQLTIRVSRTSLVEGLDGVEHEATVTITRTGSTAGDLVVSLAESPASQLLADVDGSFIYAPLPNTVTITDGNASVDVYVVAKDDSFATGNRSATLTAGAAGFAPADQVFSIEEDDSAAASGFETWAGAGVTPTPGLVEKYAIGGASGPGSGGEKHAIALDSASLNLTAIVRVNDPDLTVVGEAVTNPADFGTPAAISVSGAATADQSGLAADPAFERRIFSVPRGSDPKKFLRLKATLATAPAP